MRATDTTREHDIPIYAAKNFISDHRLLLLKKNKDNRKSNNFKIQIKNRIKKIIFF